MKQIKLFLLFLVLVLADQLTKFLMQNKTFMLTGWLGLNYAENAGAVFGFLQGFAGLVIVISFIAIIILIYSLVSRKYGGYELPITIILSGITGNTIDRLWLGYVRDFIQVSIWPTFNIADSCLTIGVLWICIIAFGTKRYLKNRTS